MPAISFQKITKYLVTAVCTQPLYIGSSMGDKEEVLVHPVDDVPFIQATSIAGVFRGYYAIGHDTKEVDDLFGVRRSTVSENSTENGSKIRISDGRFCEKNLILELRPRVSINPETGTCEAGTIKGTDKKAGYKFNMEYIGAGAAFEFAVYLYDEESQKALEGILSALHQEQIQLGGQKSNGCGYMSLVSVKRKVFDMTVASDRRLWALEDALEEKEYMDDILAEIKTEKIAEQTGAYEIVVKGRTEGNLLVKSIAVPECGKDAPDCMNLRNAAENYIVPGSSLKGAVRNRMEKIAGYLKREDIIRDTFGYTGATPEDSKAGNIIFHDTVVGDRIENDKVELSHRIHIDKFTGGVMDGGLFHEKNVFGDMDISISIKNYNHPENTCGLLLMALRDLAIGVMNIGSGYNVGKGIINVDKIVVKDIGKRQEAAICFEENGAEGFGITGEKTIISQCIKAAQEEVAI